MDPTLAPKLLALVLLFLMNGHDVGAGDIKVELRDQKQLDWYKATPGSNDKLYITRHKTTSESAKPRAHVNNNQPNYIGGHKTNNHNLNIPYVAEYKTSAHVTNNQPNYIGGHRTNTHDTNIPYATEYKTSAHVPNNQPNYIGGYRTHTRDPSIPYLVKYKTSSHVPNNQPNYIGGHRTHTRDPNIPYVAEYKTSAHVTNNQLNYIGGHMTNTANTNIPYVAEYKTSAHVSNNQPYYIGRHKTNTHDLNIPYVAEYKTSAHLTNNQPNYIGGHRTNTHDLNIPYVAEYKTSVHVTNNRTNTHDSKSSAKKDLKESSRDDTTKSYITQYGEIDPKKDPKESSTVDHTEAFKTGFFTLDDLHVRNVMTLQFPIQEVSRFLQRKEAESIPFSTSQLSVVLQLFSIPKESNKANAMRSTLEQCEAEPITGETKICATSLESMLEFVSTIIGSEAKYNILTTSYPTTSGVPMQNYTILDVSENINASKWVACHPLAYPYAIYYCHFIATGSKMFKVSLGDDNGDKKIEALGLCHLDTSDWSPDRIIFKQLGIKPGKAPVCHFFPVKHLMWVP